MLGHKERSKLTSLRFGPLYLRQPDCVFAILLDIAKILDISYIEAGSYTEPAVAAA